MTTPSEKVAFERIAQVLMTAMTFKTGMLKAKEQYRKAECPRCKSVLHLRLVGSRNHIRMACEGYCGMQAME